MFEKKSAIRPALVDAGLGTWADAILKLCRPAVCFERRTAMDGRGRVWIGGVPELPSDRPWPTRRAYANWAKVAKNLSHHGPGLQRGALSGQPLYFVAQIELDEARAAGLDDALPDTGRLLFFWDANCGAWTESADACRVIWDRGPAGTSAPRDAPAELAIDDGPRDFPRAFPELPLSMRGVWSMPDRVLLSEILKDPTFDQMLDDGDCDDFWDQVDDPRLLASGREVLRHRLRGWPIPEQWDPRFAAAAAARGANLMLGPVSEAEQQACAGEMHDWTLLLQVGCAALGYAEGTVYFVMRDADLAQHNFDRVHAVFQQT